MINTNRLKLVKGFKADIVIYCIVIYSSSLAADHTSRGVIMGFLMNFTESPCIYFVWLWKLGLFSRKQPSRYTSNWHKAEYSILILQYTFSWMTSKNIEENQMYYCTRSEEISY